MTATVTASVTCVTASVTCGYCLRHIRLPPPSHTVTASVTYGYSLRHMRLPPPSHTVTASVTYGHSLHHTRLQPRSHTVTASITCGCRCEVGAPGSSMLNNLVMAAVRHSNTALLDHLQADQLKAHGSPLDVNSVELHGNHL